MGGVFHHQTEGDPHGLSHAAEWTAGLRIGLAGKEEAANRLLIMDLKRQDQICYPAGSFKICFVSSGAVHFQSGGHGVSQHFHICIIVQLCKRPDKAAIRRIQAALRVSFFPVLPCYPGAIA